MDYVIHKIAERWHMHPADVDPRLQRPARAAYFWRELEMLQLEHDVR